METEDENESPALSAAVGWDRTHGARWALRSGLNALLADSDSILSVTFISAVRPHQNRLQVGYFRYPRE